MTHYPLKIELPGLPWGPSVNMPLSKAVAIGSTPYWGTEISHATGQSKPA